MNGEQNIVKFDRKIEEIRVSNLSKNWLKKLFYRFIIVSGNA